MNIGFVKYNRTDASKNLHTRPIENHVLNVIASRVSRKGNPVKGVKIGESIASDFKNFGLKRQPLRTALANLRKWGYITTRATNKTTYAKLVNIEVYDCNLIQTNHQKQPLATTNQEDEQPTTEPTANHYQEVKKKEDKKKERSRDIVNVIDVCSFFQSETGKRLILKDTDAKIKAGNKFKLINARIQEGATIEDCKSIIRLKHKEWRNDSKMKQYIRIQTLFNKRNFDTYLDEVVNSSGSTAPKTFSYELPDFVSKNQREAYFRARLATYRPQLDNRTYNTVYHKRAYGPQRDVEGVVHGLELEKPELLNIKFVADSWLDIQ